MAASWLAAAADWSARGAPFVLVTVLAVRGSAPVRTGQRMLVSADDQHGTIGGGRLEQEVLAQARSQLAADESSPPAGGLMALGLGASLGQCCGGKVFIHYERIVASRQSIVVFGAGHVAQELVRILVRLPAEVVCVDERQQWLDKLPGSANLRTTLADDPVEQVAAVAAGSSCLILTHRHDLDLRLCQSLLQRGDMGLVGVIGSTTKAARFRRQLTARGLDADRLECPIGVPAGKQPLAVALGIAQRVCEHLESADSAGARTEPQLAALRLLSELTAEQDA